jgi:hypothetical protein
MILKTKDKRHKVQESRRQLASFIRLLVPCFLCLVLFNFSTCKYSFHDSSPIPQDVKTFRVNYLVNKAAYVNPQISPLLTEAVKTKIISNTRLRQTSDDSAHYDISGYVSNYSVSTTGISGSTPSQNRLTVVFHLIFKDKLDDSKSFEADISNNFDFSATQTLSEAESALTPTIISNTTDGIFNKIFSNW